LTPSKGVVTIGAMSKKSSDRNIQGLVVLAPGRESAVRRFHPWIFSGAIASMEGAPQPGDTVAIYDSRGEHIATGHYAGGSLAVKVVAFEGRPLDRLFWIERLGSAWRLRRALGLIDSTETDAFRLVNGEGDGLPGLIVDLYGEVAVLQAHSLAMARARDEIVAALIAVTEGRIRRVYDKSAATLERSAGAEGNADQFVYGDDAEASVVMREGGLDFELDLRTGQKTGFFLDQRDNRALVGKLARGRRVLNCFSYSGGFSLYALQGGALYVESVDVSKGAIELANRNVARNFSDVTAQGRHKGVVADCLDYLRDIGGSYDLVVLDPPAFAKHKKALEGGLRGYESINHLAFKHAKAGSFVVTFSCSQVVTPDIFANTVQRAAGRAERRVRVLHELRQAPCHPRSLHHPEGHYLKGLVLEVE
jgi:23S rRNA (cytosine1962-C5)-methyltransferase